ncbi:MAG: type I-E CRISPR-associated protein Cas7/Cse4/CasC [Acidaminococcales bacterium]|jgi:CRISPR system Cascade subunit CasC|nr:type I-E CRISPR-associated protein Cas7/Cse4/CasC [Acidaminococcales bacterium]
MMKKVFVDFHVIQTVPPSCVNRDDTGSPKTAVYGGVRRARVSSQSWKRAMRKMFREHFDEFELGQRTKKIVALVAEKISACDKAKSEEQSKKLAEEIINLAGVTTKDAEAKALFFMTGKQAENLAGLVLDRDFGSKKDTQKKKEAQIALNKNQGVDIALFGRMVADDPSLNADASAQVAHSISTHRVDNEYDYFTAVDDLAPEDNAGAGMIGTVEYNSSTLYRYATVAAHELFKQLAEEPDALAKAIKEFARAFIASMPDGKQNTFANRTLPDAVLVAVRADQPVNLAGAFEEAIRSKEDGFVKESIKKLKGHAQKVYGEFACAPAKSYVINADLSELGVPVDFKTLLDELEKEMKDRFSPGNN